MKVIQKKFIIIILSGILLSTFILGGVAVMSSNRVIKQNSKDIMNLKSEESAHEINHTLMQIERSVEIISVQALDSLKNPDKLSDKDYRKEFTDRLEGFALNIAESTEGAVGVFVRFSPEVTDEKSGFFWTRNWGEEEFHETFITDLNEYKEDDIEHVGWYYIPVAKQEATWIGPYHNRNCNVYMVSYVIPLYQDDQFIGIVGMDIDFQTFIEAVKSIEVFDTGYAFLADKDGEILYHQKKEENPERYTDKEWDNILKSISNVKSETELIPYKFHNQNKMMTFSYLNNDMKLFIAAPTSEINKERNRMLAIFVVVAILISVFFVMITIKNTNAIVRFAYKDVLTGTLNINAYHEELNHLEEQIHFSKADFAVGVLDINDLKKENDTYGHSAGDKLIIDSYNLIHQVFRKYSIYRIGGDEFVVIMKNCSEEECEKLFQNLQNETARRNLNLNAGEREIHVACGIALYDSKIDLNFADVFNRADQKMYENKFEIKQNAKNV